MKHGREGNSLRILTTILITCLFIMMLATVNDAQTSTRQSAPVYNVNAGSYHNTIQEGIDAASSGDTLEVAPGIYYENIIIDKKLTLIGANQNTTIIDGGSIDDVVLITSDWVNLTGFTIMNSGPDWFYSTDSGIEIQGVQNCSINNNSLNHNEMGISIFSSFGSDNSSLIELWHWGCQSLQINDLGHAVWRGSNDSRETNIFYWDGINAVQLTTEYYVNLGEPKINNNGQVVWRGSEYVETIIEGDLITIIGKEWDIYFWDGNEVIQITNDEIEDGHPEINDIGQIIWERDGNIFLWDEGIITQLTVDNESHGPKINNNGQAIWIAEAYSQDQLFFWDGSSITQITNYTFGIVRPEAEINDNGHVAFEKSDDIDNEICYWDGTSIIQLTNNSYHDKNPQINDNGQIVWQAQGNIMLWDGDNTIQITNTQSDEHPKINNNGQLVWNGYFNSEIYYWDGVKTTILTVGELFGGMPQINDNGHVIWDDRTAVPGGVLMWNGGDISANYANNNTIFNNTIEENEHGIRIETAYGNLIYHNLFLNNSNQSFCQQSNDWDLGYPKGGNFWSDYDGTDEYSGPDQDIPGSDGIGDKPYSISGGDYVDHYPIMSSAITPPIGLPGDPTGLSWMPIVLGSAIGLSIALGMSLEIIGYSLFVALLALYSKLKKDKVLDQYLRGKIHGYIIANPGEHYNGIKKALKLNNGSLAYHLSILEKEELVKSRNDGMFKRFFPYGQTINEADIQSNTQTQVQTHISNNPGITQKQLAARLGISPSTVNYHAKNLQKNDLISAERKGFNVNYYENKET